MSRTLRIPAGQLADELEFAICYLAACNRGRDLLGADRRLFAQAIVDMLFERANSDSSGMQVTSGGNGDPRAGTSS